VTLLVLSLAASFVYHAIVFVYEQLLIS